MWSFLVELGPCRRKAPATGAIAATVARSFGRRRSQRAAEAEQLRSLARRRLGVVRLPRTE